MFNLARSLDRNAGRAPHEDAVIFRATRLTHLQLHDRVNALAAAFREAGVVPPATSLAARPAELPSWLARRAAREKAPERAVWPAQVAVRAELAEAHPRQS